MPRLAVQGVSMQFPAVRALHEVTLTFEPGEVHGLVGENGAGKSTLMRIVSGLQTPTSGEVLLDGKPVHFRGARDAFAAGIAMIHQELNLVDELTVAENIFLGREPTRGGVLDRGKMEAEAQTLLSAVQSKARPDQRVAELSIAGKQLVEIAKALSYRASILVMDEPTAVLSEPEAEALFALVEKLSKDGVTVLYISHLLGEVCRICDRISVLRDGQWVKTVSRGETDPSDLASAMVGRPLSDVFPAKRSPSEGPPLLTVRGVRVPGWVHDASFDVRAGEILGLAGLVGSGRTELAEAIVGARKKDSGEVLVDGNPVRIRSPREAMAQGIVYVSEDRKALGLILSMSVVQNTTMANLSKYATPFLQPARERASAEAWKERLDLRAGDLQAPVGTLSGGNQQKVALAKWLDTEPRAIVLDEPTRGVDVGAKREIYALIADLASQGLAVVLISSEMNEIIGLCHRALVMRDGRIAGEVTAGIDMDEETIMHLAAGVEAA